jgi:hypothetical protein
MKVLGAAFVTLMRMQSASTPRLLCGERCATRERAKLALAPTTAGWPQHRECGSCLRTDNTCDLPS